MIRPVVMAAVLILWTFAATPAANAAPVAAEQARFQRPDAGTIRAQTQDVLDQAKFHHRKKWSLTDWLLEQLASWKLGDVGGGTWGKVLVWVFIVWGVLAVLAVLAHLVWTIVKLVRGRSGDTPFGASPQHGNQLALGKEELLRRTREAAGRGEYALAVAFMMSAMLAGLAERKVVRLETGKTNGDYAREYPAEVPGRDLFRGFVRTFDTIIYGRAACGRQTYEEMNAVLERLAAHGQ